MEIKREPYDKLHITTDVGARNSGMSYIHLHECYELYYLVEGSRKYFIDSAIYQIEVGDAVLIPPEVLHRTIGDRNNAYTRVVIYIPKYMIEDLFLEHYESSVSDCIYTIPANRRRYFDNLMDKVSYEYNRREYKRDDEFSDYLMKNYINELLIFLTRIKRHHEPAIVDNETDKLIGAAARYIRENYNKGLTLEDVASHVKISKNYLSKTFKEKTGFGFSDYLAAVRVAQACKLLAGSRLDVTEIALRCGYNDSAYFSTVFKKLKGVTPLKYRKSTEI